MNMKQEFHYGLKERLRDTHHTIPIDVERAKRSGRNLIFPIKPILKYLLRLGVKFLTEKIFIKTSVSQKSH